MKYLLTTGMLLFVISSLHSQNAQIADIVNSDAAKQTASAGILAAELKALGFQVKEDLTGIVYIFRNGTGPVVMYRADMICNAVKETGLRNTNTHQSCLTGVAKIMVKEKAKWSGTLILIGQPAEESTLVAQTTINDGLHARHSIPQPHHLFATYTTAVPAELVRAAKCARAVGHIRRAIGSQDCQHLVIHITPGDHSYFVVSLNAGYEAEPAAIQFGDKTGAAALLEIFKWATASR